MQHPAALSELSKRARLEGKLDYTDTESQHPESFEDIDPRFNQHLGLIDIDSGTAPHASCHN